MKKLIFLSILLVAGLAAWYFISRSRWDTVRTELRDFAVTDTGTITKIFLAERAGEKVLLEKQADGRWKVNGKFYAEEGRVKNLLEVIRLLAVKGPVPERDKEEILADMAAQNTKVEIFRGDDLVKTYFVGDNTQDELGTYMLLDGSSAPFVMHIPGFKGFLNVRYFVQEKEWKTTEVFAYDIPEIASISVEYPGDPQHSFIISSNGGRSTIRPMNASAAMAGTPDTSLLKFYKGYFRKAHFEGYERNVSKEFVDSFLNAQPYAIIKVTAHNGRSDLLKVYHKPIDVRTKVETDLEGNPLKYDIERYYAFHNNNKDLLVIQDYVFRHILRKYGDFLLESKTQIVN